MLPPTTHGKLFDLPLTVSISRGFFFLLKEIVYTFQPKPSQRKPIFMRGEESLWRLKMSILLLSFFVKLALSTLYLNNNHTENSNKMTVGSVRERSKIRWVREVFL